MCNGSQTNMNAYYKKCQGNKCAKASIQSSRSPEPIFFSDKKRQFGAENLNTENSYNGLDPPKL